MNFCGKWISNFEQEDGIVYVKHCRTCKSFSDCNKNNILIAENLHQAVDILWREIFEKPNAFCVVCGKKATYTDYVNSEHSGKFEGRWHWIPRFTCDEHREIIMCRVGGRIERRG